MGWRLFVAVHLGEDVRRSLERLQAELRALSPRSRWVPPENALLTLAFLGSVEEALVPRLSEAVGAVAAGAAPFGLEVLGGGAFGSSRRPRVLWAGVEGDLPALSALHRRTEEALQPLGYRPEAREYRPHLTLARARDERGDRQLARAAAALVGRSLGASRIDRLILFRSHPGPGGARYTPLVEPALGG